MSNRNHLFHTTAVTLAALGLFSVGTVNAQNAASTAPASTEAKAAGSQVSKADQRMMKDIAEANIAEIQTGELAQQKGASDQVKTFGKMMVDDHSKALSDLRDLASRKSVELPDDTDMKHKATAMALKALSGATFDKQYMSMVGVSDHRNTHEMLQKVQREAKDPDLRAYAAKTLPVVHGHLSQAEQLTGKTKASAKN